MSERYENERTELDVVSPLWTRDFTIITLGSVVSMLGNSMSGFALSLLVIQDAAAKCGSVNYSLGADGLALMHDYVVTMMLYVLYIIYAVSAIFVIYASLQVYIKMNIGEEGVVKDIMMIVGACLFMIGASIAFPAFFGYQI